MLKSIPIKYFNKPSGNYRTCKPNSEKAKELRDYCPFTFELTGRKEPCDCNDTEYNNCLEDI